MTVGSYFPYCAAAELFRKIGMHTLTLSSSYNIHLLSSEGACPTWRYLLVERMRPAVPSFEKSLRSSCRGADIPNKGSITCDGKSEASEEFKRVGSLYF